MEEEQGKSEDEDVSGSEDGEEYDPARGIGVASSSEDEASEDEEEIGDGDFETAIVEEDIPKGDATSRLAAVNLDWDNIRAVDILAVLQSFIPVVSNQTIEKVSIYPSEFGKERMQKEAIEGPALDSEKLPETSNGNREVDTTSLRKYQLERLRYYYAVIVCTSVSTANALYKALDGAELGSTANLLDLRFIPDGMTFDDTPRDEATRLLDDYEPAEFVTDALQHSKPKLTWEAEDPARKRLVSEAFQGDGDSRKWSALLASSDEEEDGDEEARENYRKLLLGDNVSAPSASANIDLTIREDDEGDDVPVKPDKEGEEDTTLDSYKRKERERKQRKYEAKQARKQASQPEEPTADLGFDDPFFTTTSNSEKRKQKDLKRQAKDQAALKSAQQAQELGLLMHDETSGDHFNINHILKAQKAGKHAKRGKRDAERERDLQEGFEMDVRDPRFADVYSGGDFAIDPNNAAFRKGLRGMELVLEESRRRKREAEGTTGEKKKKRR
jgi:NUC153 domain